MHHTSKHSEPCAHSTARDARALSPLSKQRGVVDQASQLSLVSLLGRVAEIQPNPKEPNDCQKIKKRVRFCECADVYEYKDKELFVGESLWWTDDDFRRIRRECLEVVHYFRRHEEYMWAIDLLHEFYESDRNEEVSEADLNQACTILADCRDARGLEKRIDPGTKEYISEHRESTLDAAQLWSKGASFVRKTSRSLSTKSYGFAAALADFDAQEAAVVYLC